MDHGAEPALAEWVKSSFSGTGNCVEVMFLPDSVRVRDSKHPWARHHEFTHAEWRAFTSGVQAGELLLPEGAS